MTNVICSQKDIKKFICLAITERRISCKVIPPIEDFYSLLTGPVAQEDYNYTKYVYDKLGQVTLGQMNLGVLNLFYLKSDIYLLFEVFCKFRDIFYNDFVLDCAQFVSLPQYSFEVLKFNLPDMQMEIPNCVNIQQFCKNSIKGRISIAVKPES